MLSKFFRDEFEKLMQYSKVKSEEYKVKKSKRTSNTSKKVLPVRKFLKQRVSKAKNIYQRSHSKLSINLSILHNKHMYPQGKMASADSN